MLPSDQDDIVRLLTRTLGWHHDDRHRELFEWKHGLSPFGVSPGWVAEDEIGLAGFRTLMRWEFLVDGRPVRAVRAVDTATDPRAQGRGIFRALTLRGVQDMVDEGVDFVFNTPNAQSAPGYLSMGWQAVGRLPISFRPSGPSSIPKLLSARTAGDLWSNPSTFGEGAADVLADTDSLSRLLASVAERPSKGATIRTNRTVQFLQWRFGRCPVGYRAVLLGKDLLDGLLLCRVRTRGAAQELVVAEILAPTGQAARALLRKALRQARPDYAVALGASRPRLWPPVPRRGPLLTWRRLNWSLAAPSLERWQLSTGDVELF